MRPGPVLLWAATVAGLGFSLWSAWVEAPSLTVVVLVFVSYASVILSGVFFPRLGMYAAVVSHGPSNQRNVALTFDDGPHPVSTRRVLEALDNHGAKATFFVVGYKVAKYPEVVREIVASGHTLGLHSYDHARLYSLRPPAQVLEDIRRTQDVIEDAVGLRPVLFRPPIGFISPRTAAGAQRAGVRFVAWSARGFDGRREISASSIVRRIEKDLAPGAIVLLHDAAEREDFMPSAPEALSDLLQVLKQRSLSAVTLETLLQLPPMPRPAPGDQA